jgi:hypothetical protein
MTYFAGEVFGKWSDVIGDRRNSINCSLKHR